MKEEKKTQLEKVPSIQKKNYHRTVLLINPKFQLHFMFWILAVTFVTIGIFYFANFYFFHKFIQDGIEIGLPRTHVYFRLIELQQYTMNVVFILTSVVAFLVLGGFGLVISHRVAGPLYRLRRHLLDTTEQETLKELRFRKKDYFQEIAAAYNVHMKWIKKRLGEKDSENKNKTSFLKVS